jgi:hypothetical protein
VHARDQRTGDRHRRAARRRSAPTVEPAGPESDLSPAGLLHLQRTAGNRAAVSRAAVGRAVQRAGDTTTAAAPPTPEAARRAFVESVLGPGSHRWELVRNAGRRDAVIEARLLARLKKGPMFSPAELAAIQHIDPGWLSDVGVGTYQDARSYLATGRYHNWLRLAPGKRILAATLAFTADRGKPNGSVEHKTPAYTLGRAMFLHQAADQTPEEVTALLAQRDEQIRTAFVDTLLPGGPDQATDEERGMVASSREILTRVFLILQNGLKVYQEGQDGVAGAHVDYNSGNVANALASGGRVTIRIPQLLAGDDAFALPDWLGVTKDGEPKAPVTRRDYSTHDVAVGRNAPGRPGTFKERGGPGTGVLNGIVHWAGKLRLPVRRRLMFGVDLAAGGWGRLDFNQEVITPDGGHGHMFIGFRPPTGTKDGALQIGMESTAPGSHNSPVGYQHTWRSSEKTANPESSFHGHKTDKIGTGKQSQNQRLVVLSELGGASGWQSFLADLQAFWDAQERARSEDEADLRRLYEELVGPRAGRFTPGATAGQEA